MRGSGSAVQQEGIRREEKMELYHQHQPGVPAGALYGTVRNLASLIVRCLVLPVARARVCVVYGRTCLVHLPLPWSVRGVLFRLFRVRVLCLFGCLDDALALVSALAGSSSVYVFRWCLACVRTRKRDVIIRGHDSGALAYSPRHTAA